MLLEIVRQISDDGSCLSQDNTPGLEGSDMESRRLMGCLFGYRACDGILFQNLQSKR